MPGPMSSNDAFFQSPSRVRLFVTPMDCSMPGLPVHHQIPGLLKLMSIESVMPSNHVILCHPLLLLPSIFPKIRVFSNESALPVRWPKYWSFSFSISPSNEHPRLISFRMDWLDLLAVQGTLKSLLQYRSSKASILRLSAFFIVQLFATPRTVAHCTLLSSTFSQSLLKNCPLSVMPSSHLILCHPFLLPH